MERARKDSATAEVVNLNGPFGPQSTGAIKCKFVALARGNHYVLIFGPLDRFPYHASLLDRYCQDRRTPSHWIKRPDQLQLDDPQYRVLGGGYLEIDPARHKLRFSGSSKAYGYFDADAVRLVTSSEPFFADYAIQIDS